MDNNEIIYSNQLLKDIALTTFGQWLDDNKNIYNINDFYDRIINYINNSMGKKKRKMFQVKNSKIPEILDKMANKWITIQTKIRERGEGWVEDRPPNMDLDMFVSYFTDGQSELKLPRYVPTEEEKEKMKEEQIARQKEMEANPDYNYKPSIPSETTDIGIQQPVPGSNSEINTGSTKTDDVGQTPEQKRDQINQEIQSLQNIETLSDESSLEALNNSYVSQNEGESKTPRFIL